MQLINQKNGKPEDVGDDDILSALAQGTHTPVNGRALVSPDGHLYISPLENVSENLNKYGYSIPTQGQLDEFSEQKKYGEGAGNLLKTGVEGALRGATFHGSDVLEQALGISSGEAIRGREKYNPSTATLSELGGAVGSSFVDPLAPTAVVGRLGAGIAERLAPRALGEGATLAAKVLNASGKIAARGAGSLVEGALYSSGQQLGEAALGDPESNAEKVISNIGLGALYGGVLGGLVKTGELALPAAYGGAAKAISNLYQKFTGKASAAEEASTSDATSNLKQVITPEPYQSSPMSKLLSVMTGKPEEQVLEDLSRGSSGEVMTPQERKAFAATARDTIQEVWDTTKKINKSLFEGPRAEEIGALTRNIEPEVVGQELSRLQSVVDEHAEAMRADPDTYNQGAAKYLEKISSRVQSAIDEPENVDKILKINNIKKDLDGRAKRLLNPLKPTEEQESGQLLKDVAQSFRDSLENEDIFGANGARQAEINKSYADYKNAQSLFQKYFMEKSPGITRFVASGTKLDALFNAINDPVRGAPRLDAARKFFDAAKELGEQAKKTHLSTSFENADVQPLVDKIQASNVNFDRAKNITQEAPGGFGALTDWFHPVSAVVRLAKSSLNPQALAGQLANIERAAQKTSSKIENAVADIVKPGILTRAAGPLGEMSSEVFQERRKEIEERNQSPEDTIDKSEWATRDIYPVAPNIGQAIQTKMNLGSQFLSSKLPKGPPPMPLDKPYKPTPSDISKFNQYYRIVHRPLAALDDLREGKVRDETIETLSTVYPNLYNEMKTSLMDQITEKISKKDNLDYQKRLALSRFMGMPLDSSGLPQVFMANQVVLAKHAAMKAAEEAGHAKGMSNITLSSRSQTMTQRDRRNT